MREVAPSTATGRSRPGIPRVASLATNPERIEQLWAMTAEERVAAAQQGRLTLGEMLRWAARAHHEIPLVNGEFFFITAMAE